MEQNLNFAVGQNYRVTNVDMHGLTGRGQFNPARHPMPRHEGRIFRALEKIDDPTLNEDPDTGAGEVEVWLCLDVLTFELVELANYEVEEVK